VETPPRVREAFVKVRQRLLPVVTRQLYLDARATLDRKERDEAVKQFENLLKIIDGAGAASASLADLRVLADGFLDLSRALPATTATNATANSEPAEPAVAAALPAAPPPPESGTAATRPAAVTPTSSAARTPAPPVARPPAAAVSASGAESRPFALSQELPAWSATDALSRRSTFSGAVTVRIGTDGRVESAEITRTVHPTYDQLLLRAARNWRYQPAMRDGKPVASELTVEVSLRPAQ